MTRTRTPHTAPRGALRSCAAAVGMAAALVVAPVTPALAEEPIVIAPETAEWRSVGAAGMEVAVLSGDPGAAGVYSMLIRVPAGTRIPPHTHPDLWRHSVILSGTLLFGFGETWDAAAMEPFGPGTFWTETPDAPHFAWARDGEVVAMLTAMGPTGSVPAGTE